MPPAECNRRDRPCGNDAVVEPLQPGLALARDLRVEAAVAVPRHGQADRADVGQQRLARHAVAAVPAAAAGRVELLMAQVPGHLLGQRPLQHGLGDLGQLPVRARQLHALGLGLAQQLVGHLLVDQRSRAGWPTSNPYGAPSLCPSLGALARAAVLRLRTRREWAAPESEHDDRRVPDVRSCRSSALARAHGYAVQRNRGHGIGIVSWVRHLDCITRRRP